MMDFPFPIEKTARFLRVRGIVQGVGFRPFVYNLANNLGLSGSVRNTSQGVEILLEGQPGIIELFINILQSEPPPLARIDSVEVKEEPLSGISGFTILESQPEPGEFQPVSPDIAICKDCLRELFDPGDRRYRYPFINCTNCGPRFTIIKDIPYDRPLTSMSGFRCARIVRRNMMHRRTAVSMPNPPPVPSAAPLSPMRKTGKKSCIKRKHWRQHALY